MALRDCTVIVTGGAMGIGRFIALGCADRGAKVAIADIDEDALAAVQIELESHGHQVLMCRADVRIEADVQRLMSSVATEFGRIDYLVNNAAIVPHFNWGGPRWPRLVDMDFSFWSKVVDTNLHGSVLCAKYALPYMEQQGSGHIVNFYGGGSLEPPGAMAYILTKEALVVFSRCLAEEVRPFNICVLSVDPGQAIATERAPEEARKRMPGPESVGERFFLAADADMSLSGHLVTMVNGKLVIKSHKELD